MFHGNVQGNITDAGNNNSGVMGETVLSHFKVESGNVVSVQGDHIDNSTKIEYNVYLLTGNKREVEAQGPVDLIDKEKWKELAERVEKLLVKPCDDDDGASYDAQEEQQSNESEPLVNTGRLIMYTGVDPDIDEKRLKSTVEIVFTITPVGLSPAGQPWPTTARRVLRFQPGSIDRTKPETNMFSPDIDTGSVKYVSFPLYEEDIATAARTTAIDGARWDWEHEFQDLRSGLENSRTACERERRASSPIQATKTERVGSRKSMTTIATLYCDGKLMVEVETDCNNPHQGLRGRVLIVVRDKGWNTIGVTNEIQCATRGGTWDIFTPSWGKEIFTLQFPRDIGQRAIGLDIYQTDAIPLGHVSDKILQVAKVAIAAVA